MSIQIDDLSKVYRSLQGDDVVALEGMSTSIEDGEFVSLVGPSGCGKSTLLDLLVGLTEPTSGSVLINGEDAQTQPPGMGLVFQSPVLLPWRTVAENVHLPAEVGKEVHGRKQGGVDLKKRADELIELVGLEAFKGKYPWELSGGMQARVAIARALLLETRVLCLDEPFAALDEFTREQMHLELLRIVAQRQITTVFVTHNIFEAVFLSDRVLVMAPRPGRVVRDVRIDLPRNRDRKLIGSPEFATNVAAVRDAMETYWEETDAVTR